MATIDELLRIPGVVAAGEFNYDGTLVDYKGRIEPEVAQAAAQFCATVSMMFRTLSGSFQSVSGMEWTPFQGWAYAGGKYSACIGTKNSALIGVFVETARADYNELFLALVGAAA